MCAEPKREERPFSVEAWQGADRDTRYLYVEDLIRSKKLNGLSAEEAKALLGPPDHETGEGLRYKLKPFCRMDSWNLDIELDNGRVKSYETRPD